MDHKLKTQILAFTTVFISLVAVATMRPSNVRAADGDYQQVDNWAQLPPGMQ
jgi:hypothetical protein